jgi:tRNA A-37 threonylcarbamoyl transferase component Bud32
VPAIRGILRPLLAHDTSAGPCERSLAFARNTARATLRALVGCVCARGAAKYRSQPCELLTDGSLHLRVGTIPRRHRAGRPSTVMSNDRRDLIFEQALGLEGKAREDLLADACRGDEQLRQQLEHLLAIDGRHNRVGDGAPPPHREIEQVADVHSDAGASLDRTLIPAVPLIMSGQKVGRFLVRREIGRGGMSRVYEALDPAIDRAVALKVLSASGMDEGARSRFFQELRLLGKVQSDHIVRVYEFGEHNDALYLVMELLEGEDLDASIAAGRVATIERKLDIALQVAEAVSQIHRAGIVHRDIKPGNVFLESSGRAKLLDFGIAHSGPRESGGTIIGTPEYLAPEQIRGRATVASDVYSYGVLLFQLFTGRKPFTGDDVLAILSKVAFECLPSEPIVSARVPDSVGRLIMSLAAKDPQARPDIHVAISHLNAALAETGGRAVAAGVTATPRFRSLRRVSRAGVAAAAAA